ncbi:MAG: SCO family protein [Chloroherpetonaceae bacterium]|nr:SCO family protein [Chloroherpetonaceae bacterium]MDW8020771.1 SCO family protein [Chloroherpetonaceae bacterium]
MKHTLRLFSALAAGVIVITALAVFAIQRADFSRQEIPIIAKVPPFRLEDQYGNTVTEADLLGKITILDFIFTRCPGACPVMTKQMAELYRLYASSQRVQFFSITVDPDYDTPLVLRQYAEANGVYDTRWRFLRASIDSVITLSEKGFMLPAENLPAGHSTKFVLIDPEGRIRGYFSHNDNASIAVLKTQIRELAKPFLAEEAAARKQAVQQ